MNCIKKIKGTGKKMETKFLSPFNKRHSISISGSCAKCHTYWMGEASSECPFCGESMQDICGVEHRVVPGAQSVSPYLKLLLKIEELKAEIQEHQLKSDKVFRVMPSENNFDEAIIALRKAEKTRAFHAEKIKFISCNISKLEKMLR